MAKVDAYELSDGLLDWAVALAEGLPTRRPKSVTEEQIEHQTTPFILYKVDGAPIDVTKVTVTRFSRGDDFLSPPGCIQEGLVLHYSDQYGREGCGSTESFYLDQSEADLAVLEHECGSIHDFHPSRNWRQGGPLIDFEELQLDKAETGEWWARSAVYPNDPVSGPTLLVAALRCIVGSKLGLRFNIPNAVLAQLAPQYLRELQRRARPRG